MVTPDESREPGRGREVPRASDYIAPGLYRWMLDQSEDWMLDQSEERMKERAIKEIRRRMEAATDKRQRVKLRVLEKVMERDSMIEPVGEIVDVSGDVFGYAFGLLRMNAEFIGDPLAYISVRPIVNDVRNTFLRYAECANKIFKFDEHEEKACVEFLIAYYAVGG